MLVVIPASLLVIVLSVGVLAGLAWLTLPIRPAGATIGGATQVPSSRATLVDVRACSVDDFDSNNDRCGTNRAGKTFQTNQVACSATVQAPSGTPPPVAFTLLYGGKPVMAGSAQLRRHGSVYAAYSGFSLGDVTLPGGRWGCRFSVPKQQQDIGFQINGPNGPLLYNYACSASDVSSPSGIVLCRTDQNVVKAPQSIACTAVVTGALHRQVKLDVAFDGAGSTPAATRSSYGTADSELFGASVRLGPSDFGAPSVTMPPGAYTCTWSLDGQQIGQKQFQVQ